MPLVWSLWLQSQALGNQPSDMLGLVAGSYEAFCLDQAVWYAGSTIQNELEKVGHKRQKGEGSMISARRRLLGKFLGEDTAKQQFADPSAMFS